MADEGRRLRLRLINPKSPLSTLTLPDVIGRMTFSRKAIFMPVNLAVCAAVAPPNWEVEIVDECVDEKPHVPKADVDLVGIGAMTTQAKRAYAIADGYRELGVPVVLGGIHPSALPDEALQHADAVCRGDAEGTLPVLLRDLAAGRPLQRIYDWAALPPAEIATPRKDLLRPEDYLVFNPIQTTRGCPHGCSFCTTPAIFGRKFRQRSISSIVDEIGEAKERGSGTFIFSDDNFAGNQKWAMELCAQLEKLQIGWASQCDILISRNDKLLAAMRRSGCLGLILGLESTNQESLSGAGKRFVQAESYRDRIAKIQSHRISLWGAFILGLDGDTWRHAMQTVRFAEKADLCMSCYPILTPYPGTEIYDRFLREGRLICTDWDRYNGANVVFEPRGMSRLELRHAQMAAFCEFYRPESAWRRLRVYPLKKRAWAANLAIHRGMKYYYDRQNREMPRFADFLDESRRSRPWQETRARLDNPDEEIAECGMRSAD